MRSKQDAYNIAKARIISQGCRAWDDEADQCVYRTREGYACAVGALLPDGSPFVEDLGPASSLIHFDREGFFSAIDMEPTRSNEIFLQDLQVTHDMGLKNPPQDVPWTEFVQQVFGEFAIREGLTP